MATLNRILETAVYVDDVERARRFYEEVMGLKPLLADRRLTAYDIGGQGVLLVFRRGASMKSGGVAGRQHHSGARWRGTAASGFRHRRGSACRLGGEAQGPRGRDRRPRRVAARRQEHLFPRSGWPPHRACHPRALAGLLKKCLVGGALSRHGACEKSAAPSVVLAGLDPAIQCHTEFMGFFVDGPVKPGHDSAANGRFFTGSRAEMACGQPHESFRGARSADCPEMPDIRQTHDIALGLRPV